VAGAVFFPKNIKMVEITERTVADVVTENIRTADVFKKHGIDFCCGGKVSIKSACEKKGVDYDQIINELAIAGEEKVYKEDFSWWDLEVLIDHIVEKHHAYVTDSIPILIQYAEKVAKVHGEHAPENIEISRLFKIVAAELASHMQKEEMILFPYIKNINAAKKSGVGIDTPHFATVENPIRMMEAEHEAVGDIFKNIRKLSNDYTPPEWACNTYRALYAKLEEFETDLHVHIHLENNILHPQAVKIESELLD
jgi:regulator of cell morphogenesis and NO signaling